MKNLSDAPSPGWVLCLRRLFPSRPRIATEQAPDDFAQSLVSLG